VKINVNAKPVTASIAANNKVYDGTMAATTTCSLTGVVSVDSASVTCTAGSATFADKNVGTGKLVTATGITLAGTAAANYALTSTTATSTANITALHITGSFTASNKIYDGNTSATVLTRALSGAISGDLVSLTGGTATFSTRRWLTARR